MAEGWRLPSGATGFWGPRSARLADTDRRAFATYAYEAARLSGGRVLTIAPAGATPNFHTAVIVRDEVRVALLGHAHLPLTAIADAPTTDSATVAFVEDEALRDAANSIGTFRLLTVEELRTPLTRVDLSSLDSAEHTQIAYWKPETAGEVLFNYWD